MKIMQRISIWGRVIYSLLATFGGVRSNILTADATVEAILGGKSLIRFGDGEFGIYRAKDIHYQHWSEELKRDFDTIKERYESDPEGCPYILAVPRRFMTVSGFRLMKKRVYVSSWAESRLQFKRSFRRDIPYGDSFLFEKDNREIYGRLWAEDTEFKNVIFVHNSEECAANFAATYRKNTVHIKCPPKDAYAEVDRLEAEILETVSANSWSADDVCITISAGPAGKVLVLRLSERGYHCIDSGHCWDDPLEGI